MAQQSVHRGDAESSGETTVLFVDDDPDLLETYEYMYQSEYEVLTAEGGDEALEKFDSHVDFAFLDRRMPAISGDELLETLREEGYETPVAILSAVERDTDITAEFEEYLSKPSEKAQVCEIIDRYTS